MKKEQALALPKGSKVRPKYSKDVWEVLSVFERETGTVVIDAKLPDPALKKRRQAERTGWLIAADCVVVKVAKPQQKKAKKKIKA